MHSADGREGLPCALGATTFSIQHSASHDDHEHALMLTPHDKPGNGACGAVSRHPQARRQRDCRFWHALASTISQCQQSHRPQALLPQARLPCLRGLARARQIPRGLLSATGAQKTQTTGCSTHSWKPVLAHCHVRQALMHSAEAACTFRISDNRRPWARASLTSMQSCRACPILSLYSRTTVAATLYPRV